ncbi:lipopolysaccharide assembly protein LapA domain-containing protein [Pseudomonas grimontii]|uniref:lipopolysaccharide assembly protein LapA domain-containing protein n=1 Tax=Pseudomonas grimontii TaxID=129847 RepID=UPI00387AAEA7
MSFFEWEIVMMRIKRFLLIFALFLPMLAILVFVLENQQNVSLSLLGLTTGQMPISVFVVLALILGMLIGPLLGALFRNRRDRTRNTMRSSER